MQKVPVNNAVPRQTQQCVTVQETYKHNKQTDQHCISQHRSSSVCVGRFWNWN